MPLAWADWLFPRVLSRRLADCVDPSSTVAPTAAPNVTGTPSQSPAPTAFRPTGVPTRVGYWFVETPDDDGEDEYRPWAQLIMEDQFGDGWEQNYYNLYKIVRNATGHERELQVLITRGTLDEGFGPEVADLSSYLELFENYVLEVNGGSWKSEVVWHLGTMTGGAPDRRCFRTFEREVSLTFEPDVDDRGSDPFADFPHFEPPSVPDFEPGAFIVGDPFPSPSPTPMPSPLPTAMPTPVPTFREVHRGLIPLDCTSDYKVWDKLSPPLCKEEPPYDPTAAIWAGSVAGTVLVGGSLFFFFNFTTTGAAMWAAIKRGDCHTLCYILIFGKPPDKEKKPTGRKAQALEFSEYKVEVMGKKHCKFVPAPPEGPPVGVCQGAGGTDAPNPMGGYP